MEDFEFHFLREVHYLGGLAIKSSINFYVLNLSQEVLVSFSYLLGFLFPLKGVDFSYFFCVDIFCCVLFLIHDDYGLDLKVLFS